MAQSQAVKVHEARWAGETELTLASGVTAANELLFTGRGRLFQIVLEGAVTAGSLILHDNTVTGGTELARLRVLANDTRILTFTPGFVVFNTGLFATLAATNPVGVHCYYVSYAATLS